MLLQGQAAAAAEPCRRRCPCLPPPRALQMDGCPRFLAGLIMEGGSFHVDGEVGVSQLLWLSHQAHLKACRSAPTCVPACHSSGHAADHRGVPAEQESQP